MSFFNWRKLNFFDILRDVDKGEISKNLGEGTITCTTSGRGNVIFGDSNGQVWLYNRHWESTCVGGWEAGPVEQLVLPRLSNHLFGLGCEAGVRCIKVWDLEKDCAQVRVSRPTPGQGGPPTEPVMLAVNENLQLMAIAFENGTVLLQRGDVTKEKGLKNKVLIEKGETVSGLHFIVTSSAILLYVATLHDVVLFYVGVKDKETKVCIDTLGCEPGLAVATTNFDDAHLITGQKDALYFYNPEGRGQCYVLDGRKKILNWSRGYLAVAIADGSNKDSVTIFDVQNKIICFSAPVKSLISICAEWGTVLLISADGKIIQLVEKDLQSKLQILFKKNFYDVAIKLARSQNLGKEGLVDIFRQYGDHLYEKGDHSGAIDQYEKTIGCLEPSYVIRKYLDTQKIHNLTAYLQALHRKGEATEDHTTLLLNCYTKLKDNKNLDAFIMTKDREVDFDVDIAIRVCRQAGFLKHALALAEKHSKHDLYLKIQIDDNQEKNIVSINNGEPVETTSILKKLSEQPESHPELFIPFFIKSGRQMLDYLEHVVATSRKPASPHIWNTMLEYNLDVYKSAGDNREAKRKAETKIMDLLTADRSNYDTEQALVLCRLNNFPPGFLYIYQKCGLHEEILKFHFQAANYEDGILTCRRFGGQNPNLWVSALQSIAASGADVPQNYFKEVLDNIEKHRLLSPLLVVTTLSSCPTATLGVIREYLVRTLQSEDQAITEDKVKIEEYRRESDKLRKIIHALKTEAVVFQSTKCSACDQTLDLPSVHFLCYHGYHQHCFQALADNEQECPKCSEENKKILDIIKAQDAARYQHDQFHAQLEKAEDGFSIVAEYFGRGLFAAPPNFGGSASGDGGGGNGSNSMSAKSATIRQMQPGYNNKTTNSGAATMVSEARLRAEERSYGSVQTDSEARLRLAAAPATGGMTQLETEGRLRSGAGSNKPYQGVSEGRMRSENTRESSSTVGAGVDLEARLRSTQPSQIIQPQSDARLRMAEGNRNQPFETGSLTSNLSRSTPQHRQYGGGSPRLQRQAAAKSPSPRPVPSKDKVSPLNPFGSPASSESLDENNPFADKSGGLQVSGGQNPFGSPKPSPKNVPNVGDGGGANPFGDEGDDYDDELNPFA